MQLTLRSCDGNDIGLWRRSVLLWGLCDVAVGTISGPEGVQCA